MATERIIIVVEERGTRRVKREIRDVGDTSKRSAASVNLLRTALIALGGAAVARTLIRTGDSVTNIQNRLKLVTTDAANLNAVFNELVDVSNRTRTSFESNAELFTRTALATRELGLSARGS